MKLLNISKQILIGFMQDLNSAWWAEITTNKPRCVYYFGPFQTSAEAKAAYPGYIEDLNSEGAQGIIVVIKRCKPDILTMCEEGQLIK
ncbi:DUF1816 domain-containing protein [Chroococcidiopsis sp. CCMEE 29]|uniref:DUF1816 domain-containing protein n=1 Tax=Chroococcidiopsis sp. CCMEE 29 TaxID=155894 RepID=UPI002020D8C6|nr:DUF1816 domain-containing protein [Chroococcidiopsis sp. CCMEE 29]